MFYFRITYRLVLLVLWAVIMGCIAFVPCVLFRKWKSVGKVARVGQIWFLGMTKILGLKIDLQGNHDTAAGLIVSNHLSYYDILVLGATFPLRFTPKSEIASWPILGWFFHLGRPIWVKRNSPHSSRKTLKEIVNTLKHDVSLCIFPEGTTSDGKNGLIDFKSTPFEAAVGANCPAVPVLIHYEEKGDPVCWYGDITLTPHLWKVFAMKEVKAELHILNHIYPDGDGRKELTARVHKQMDDEYRKLYS